MKKKFLKSIILSVLFVGFSMTNVNAEILCKRATTLHTETCSQTSTEYSCSKAGYTETGSKKTTTITYGNLGSEGTLVSGDAFDCDVNGDGTYDESKERFYYVTDMNENTAVLIYSSNVVGGVADNSKTFAYDEDGDAYTNGPATIVKELPTTAQWNQVSLTNTTRNITDNSGIVRKAGFSYAGYAARFLTTQEVEKACNITVGNRNDGELDNCNYLLENTKYSSDELGSYGIWLETVDTAINIPGSTMYNYRYAWSMDGYYRKVNTNDVQYENYVNGIRPVIEVAKDKIEITTLKEEPIIEEPKDDNSQTVQVEDTALSIRTYLVIAGLFIFIVGISVIVYTLKYKKVK